MDGRAGRPHRQRGRQHRPRVRRPVHQRPVPAGRQLPLHRLRERVHRHAHRLPHAEGLELTHDLTRVRRDGRAPAHAGRPAVPGDGEAGGHRQAASGRRPARRRRGR
ncbi:hypothetical protein SGPA1_80143 [Streptomyces misionensis JCM 4497]